MVSFGIMKQKKIFHYALYCILKDWLVLYLDF
mgnify:CR=1 FL=1